MILCVQFEQLGALLNSLAPLIDRYQKGDSQFVSEALKWLEEVEQTMSRLRLPEGAEMSSLRSQILKAEDQQFGASDRPKRSVIRRANNVAASDALARAEEILRQRVMSAEERLQTFEGKLTEGLTAFLLENELPVNQGDSTAWLNLIWQQFKEYDATRPLLIYLSASLTATDRNFILMRVLSRLLEEPPKSPLP